MIFETLMIFFQSLKISKSYFFIKGYVENYHREGDTLGLIHIHQLPSLPAMGLYGVYLFLYIIHLFCFELAKSYKAHGKYPWHNSREA